MFLHLSVILFTGGSLSRGSLSRGSLSRGVSVQVVSVHESLCPGETLSRRFLSRGSLFGGLCPGESLSRGHCSGASVQRESLSSGGLCPDGFCPGVVSVQGDPRMIKSGRYASYWNGFLLKLLTTLNNATFNAEYQFKEVILIIISQAQ